MGRVIADRLDGDLDVVLVRKLGSPFNPEYAIGAIDESGAFELSGDSDFATVSRDYLEREKAAQLARIREQRRRWSRNRPAIDPRGRIVIAVDDGLATGATMAAALPSASTTHAARKRLAGGTSRRSRGSSARTLRS